MAISTDLHVKCPFYKKNQIKSTIFLMKFWHDIWGVNMYILPIFKPGSSKKNHMSLIYQGGCGTRSQMINTHYTHASMHGIAPQASLIALWRTLFGGWLQCISSCITSTTLDWGHVKKAYWAIMARDIHILQHFNVKIKKIKKKKNE